MAAYFEKHRSVSFDKTYSSVIGKTYLFLAMGFLLTGGATFLLSKSEAIMYAFLDTYFWFFAVLLSAIAIAFTFDRIVFSVRYGTAVVTFVIFSILIGILLSTIFLVFTIDSIFSSFLVTCLMFGTASAFGHFTKRDITSRRTLCFMGLAGVLFAGFVNIFIMNDAVSFIVSLAGILLFTWIVALDSQKIKNRLRALETQDEIRALPLYGALLLYLDFINIFIRILGFMKKPRQSG